MEPRKLGPYLLEEVLGRGGMGTVYRGIAPETGEQVAIKILAPDLSDDPSFLERFQEEVQTLLRLKHPNIVQLLSFGKQEDVFYFAMELVEGKSLYACRKLDIGFLIPM
jgi:serine/threonine-protein kinase